MTQWYMLDTNTVSHIIKGKSSAARLRLGELSGSETACISAITEAEIRFGLAKNPSAGKLHAAVEGFLSRIQTLPWRSEEARAYGEIRAELETSGKPLGNLDMLIAAHAVAVGAVLVTGDKAFLQVQHLPSTANWATDL